MSLNNKDKSRLKAKANHLKTIYQIGKNGLNDQLLEGLDKALKANELIKISVLKSCVEDVSDIADIISERLEAEIVQTIGRVIIVFRKNEDE